MSDGAIVETSLSVNNVPIRGRTGGEFLTFAWTQTQWFKIFAGVDGVGYYVLTEDRSGIVTVRVQPNAVENQVLWGILQATITSKARVPIVIKRGLTILGGLGLVLGPTNVAGSDGAMQSEWAIGSTFWGGNIGGVNAAVLGA